LLGNLSVEIPVAVELFVSELRARADAVLAGTAPPTLPAPPFKFGADGCFRQAGESVGVAARHGHGISTERGKTILGGGKAGLEIVAAGGGIVGFGFFLEHEG
jgi:hypothetical protein